jgi:hypothetical protein
VRLRNLKLLVFKLKRMQFGRSSEKLDRRVDQLEPKLEDLDVTESARDPGPIKSGSVTSTTPIQQQRRGPARRPLLLLAAGDGHAFPEAGRVPPIAAATSERLARTSPRLSNMFPRTSK